MAYEMSADGERRLEQYLDQIGERLGDERRRASFATYAMGLLSESERKSMECIAARATAEPEHERIRADPAFPACRSADTR